MLGTGYAQTYEMSNICGKGFESRLLNGNVVDDSQWSFDATTGKLTSSIPEPTTYAGILGVLALAFVAYRRK